MPRVVYQVKSGMTSFWSSSVSWWLAWAPVYDTRTTVFAITSFSRVRFQSCTRGLGCCDPQYDAWNESPPISSARPSLRSIALEVVSHEIGVGTPINPQLRLRSGDVLVEAYGRFS